MKSSESSLTCAEGLNVHMSQVHKEALSAVDNALGNRSSLEIEIFGMEGIPQEILDQHQQRVTAQYYQNIAEKQGHAGSAGAPGIAGAGVGQAKKPKFESPSDLKKRLAEHKARLAEQQANGGGSGNGTPVGAGQGQSPGGFVRKSHRSRCWYHELTRSSSKTPRNILSNNNTLLRMVRLLTPQRSHPSMDRLVRSSSPLNNHHSMELRYRSVTPKHRLSLVHMQLMGSLPNLPFLLLRTPSQANRLTVLHFSHLNTRHSVCLECLRSRMVLLAACRDHMEHSLPLYHFTRVSLPGNRSHGQVVYLRFRGCLSVHLLLPLM